VSLRKKSASAGLKVWTVAELGVFYTEHRNELVAHASRILKDSARAEEVVQDALIKVMLAAPELESTDHARGYMHRTIENLLSTSSAWRVVGQVWFSLTITQQS